MKPWRIPQIDEAAVRALGAACGADPLCCRILLRRGVSSAEEAGRFLEGEPLHDPFLMRGMDRAVAVIEAVMQEGGLIVVYGDYDCDGITATVLLYRYLEEQGANVAYYIPDRQEEGYGLNRGACDALHRNGAALVVTVDNGVTALEEIDYLRSLGIRAVVTDHHQPRETLPAAEAVLDPHREDETYPFQDLSGVGVAFKLVCALEGDTEGVDTLGRYADLVSVGTIADVVPLRGENRTIAAAGLRRLEETDSPGLLALMQVAGLGANLSAQSVAFGLAPRLNAASRLGECDKSVELMLCDDPAQAARLAAEIDGCNRKRKDLENKIVRDIAEQLAASPALARGRVIVLAGEGWHHGVVGIVASRVVERYGRPCLLLSLHGDEARGSARSVEGFSIIDALTACSDLLQKFGGHTLAAGCTLASAQVPALRDALNLYAARVCPDMPVPALRIDAILSAQEMELSTAERLARLAPFGAGNEEPALLVPGVKVEELSAIGGGKHLRLRLRVGNRSVPAVFFRQTPETFPAAAGESADLAVRLTVDEFQGQRRLSVQVLDARPEGFRQEEYLRDAALCERLFRGEPLTPEEAERLTPSREQVAVLYRALRERESLPADPDVLTVRVGRGALSFAQTRVAAETLLQAGLAAREGDRLRLLPAKGKVRLEETPVLASLSRCRVPAGDAALVGAE